MQPLTRWGCSKNFSRKSFHSHTKNFRSSSWTNVCVCLIICKCKVFKLQRGASLKGLAEGHPRVFVVGSVVSGSIPPQPLVQCVLGGVCVSALIDTGSMTSFVSKRVFHSIQPPPYLQSSPQTCISITGEPLQIEGTTHLPLIIPGNGSSSYTGNFTVSSTLCQPLQCVLGWDFLTSSGLQLRYKDECCLFP